MSGENTADDVSTAKIADKTEGFSGSDLRQLCTAAAMCGIRELMKATSKASKADAAAKKDARQKASAKTNSTAVKPVTGATSASGTGDAATSSSASSTAVGKQQPASNGDATAGAEQQSEPSHASAAGQADAAAASTAKTISQTVPQQSAQENGTHAAENGHSTAGVHNKGSKRDVEAVDSGSSKRLKSSSDQDAQLSHQEGANATDSNTASGPSDTSVTQPDAVTAQTDLHEAVSGHDQGADDNGEVAAGSSAGREQELSVVAKSSSIIARELQTDWLLSKFQDVAAAANQKV